MIEFSEVCRWLYARGFDRPISRSDTAGGGLIFRKGIGYRKTELLIFFNKDRKISRKYFEQIKAEAIKL